MKQHMNRNLLILGGLLIAAVGLFIYMQFFQPADPVELDITEVETAIMEKQVSDVVITTESHKISGTMQVEGEENSEFYSYYPRAYEESLTELLNEEETEYSTEPPPNRSLSDILWFFAQFAAIGIILWIVMAKFTGGAMKGITGLGNKETESSEHPHAGFADLGGLDEAIQEINETVEFLKDPEIFYQAKARPPKGILLEGPPGTGKTALARAVAAEADVPFYAVSGSDFVEIFAGMGARRVRELFAQAQENAPSIVFIDEIDAIGRQRGNAWGISSDEREQTLNQLLVSMDGFGSRSGVIIIAATNRTDILDSALTRPGRFDRRIETPLPDKAGREKILIVHTRGRELSDDVDFNILASQTTGFSGAQLESLINESAILAARDKKTVITRAYLEASLERLVLGVERRTAVVHESDKKVTAYHEAGHTLVAWKLAEAPNPRKVTIIPRGGSGGATWTIPDDRVYISVTGAKAQIAVSMGGRAGEKVLLGDDFTSGASHDMKNATDLAKRMIAMYGMDEKVGPIWLATSDGRVDISGLNGDGGMSEHTAQLMEKQTVELLKQGLLYAETIVKEYQEELEIIAKALIEKETLTDNDLEKLIGPAVRAEV